MQAVFHKLLSETGLLLLETSVAPGFVHEGVFWDGYGPHPLNRLPCYTARAGDLMVAIDLWCTKKRRLLQEMKRGC